MLLAHQGGWDELVWFTAPILLVHLWVRWAERHSRKREGAAPPPTLPAHEPEH